ncbi:MAG: class F sortase [Dehalococcoidia bacterium]|jgi:LPXTG-site transpeptidase (sortase) family protein
MTKKDGGRTGRSRLRSKRLWLGLAGASLALAAVAWSAWVIFGGDGSESNSQDFASVTASSPTPAPQPPQAPVKQALPVRVVIPSIGVDAPVSVKTIEPNGTMQPPNGPEDVAWYDFSARPGSGGNAVFSAHVDYHDYGPAVFARLRELKKGDAVEVRLDDGSVRDYEVVLSVTYPAATAPFQEIVGATSSEMVTLITCAGSFDEASRQYNHRLVVRAVPEMAAERALTG